MTTQSLLGRSPQLIEMETPKPTMAQTVPTKPTLEVIDADELARRLTLPVSWVRSHCRKRSTDEIPCIRFGRYVRFRWGSPELERWIQAHEERTRGR